MAKNRSTETVTIKPMLTSQGLTLAIVTDPPTAPVDFRMISAELADAVLAEMHDTPQAVQVQRAKQYDQDVRQRLAAGQAKLKAIRERAADLGRQVDVDATIADATAETTLARDNEILQGLLNGTTVGGVVRGGSAALLATATTRARQTVQDAVHAEVKRRTAAVEARVQDLTGKLAAIPLSQAGGLLRDLHAALAERDILVLPIDQLAGGRIATGVEMSVLRRLADAPPVDATPAAA